ncbi:MAG: sn-glycerol-1-phosphate dehydrogenase [Clostridia bacterium]|nr:sn-glycerol-1-phosphate dehydrogenase [Clostridia bacterium]
MEIRKFLKGNDHCPCGRSHSCDIRFVEIGDGVLAKLGEICSDFSRIVLVADGNTDPLCGKEVRAALGGKIVGEQIFGKELVVPDERSVAMIEAKMPADTDLLLGIGSGVINDLCKYTSHAHHIRYVIVATAPSMDGYASVGAAMILGGMKVTTTAFPPFAIVSESRVLTTAPMDMIRSGYGDIIGKYSCLNDWKLARLIRGEYFCQSVYDTVMDSVRETERSAAALLARDPDALRDLMSALVCVGVMMSYVGNSRPASGSEHHLAHFFEITGLLDDKPYYLHGIDVLYGANVTAALRERVAAAQPPFDSPVHDRAAWENAIRRIYGKIADSVISLQEKVGFYRDLEKDLGVISANWDDVKSILREAPGAARMKELTEAIGLHLDDFRAFYGEKKLDDAVRYAKDLKDRYTVLWISYALGIH